MVTMRKFEIVFGKLYRYILRNNILLAVHIKQNVTGLACLFVFYTSVQFYTDLHEILDMMIFVTELQE